MGLMSFGVVSPGTITDTWDPTSVTRGEPGAMSLFKDSNGNTALVEIVQLDNNGCSKGEVLVTNFATLKSYSVAKATAGDAFAPHFRGLAAATIASQRMGYMIIGGYVETADLSHTAASGELLTISGSTAGKLTPHNASSFWGATLGLSSTLGTAPFVFAIARTAIATGTGSVSILGVWG